MGRHGASQPHGISKAVLPGCVMHVTWTADVLDSAVAAAAAGGCINHMLDAGFRLE